MRTVLVVDDNAMVRGVLQQMLEAAGCKATATDDAAEAVQQFAREPVQTVLIDFDLRGATGLEACRALRGVAQRSGHPFEAWIMTGVERPELESSAAQAGARGVLHKPFTSAQLLRAIDITLLEPTRSVG